MTLIVVAAAITDFEGRMLLGRRADTGLHGPPGGKQDDGESLRAACCREVREETSLRVEPAHLVELGFCELLTPHAHQIVFWYWLSQYRGIVRNAEPEKCWGWQFMPVPRDNRCMEGLRLFKGKLMVRLAELDRRAA